MPRLNAMIILSITLALAGLSGCDDVPNISLPNEAPVAVDDTIEILQDQVIEIAVTANDSDIDGNLTEVAITTAPTIGTAEITDTNLVLYTPPDGFVGEDSLIYQITDVGGLTDEARVDITVKKRQLRALFTTDANTAVRGGDVLRRLYMIETMQPGEPVELSQTLASDESVVNWTINIPLQQVVMLTDANRIVAAPIDDPAAAESYDIELATDENVDSGFAVSAAGIAAYTVNHRFVRTISLVDDTVEDVDTGWTDGTMELQFFASTGNSVILSGTLGTGADEASAIYLQSLATVSPIQIFEDDDATSAPRTRLYPVSNSMLWLREEPGQTLNGGYACQQLPEQRLSNLLYTLLSAPTISNDLNVSSGLLDNALGIVSYTVAPVTTKTVIAACPENAELAQLIEVPFGTPSAARVVATNTDTSDLLYDVDLAPGGDDLIFVVDGDTGLRVQQVDLSVTDTSAPIGDITATLPDFQLYDDGAGLQSPESSYSEEASHFIYVAPVNDVPNRLVWVELENLDATSADLPFSATTPLSDGYYGFVSSEPDGAGTTLAMVEFANPTPAVAVVPGVMTRDTAALAAGPVLLVPVPVDQAP